GPTETVVGCCVYEVPSGARLTGTVPIGRPIARTRIHLLDTSLEPVFPGTRGELFIGGAGVARGYLGRPDLTADRFRPDPFSPSPGERLYKTGDLGRYLPGGDIEFLGRTDHQVKVRGFRIELGEVEAVLASHQAVRDCVVLAPLDSSGARRLVAYVVGPEPPNTEELRAFLAGRLPEPMVPTAFRALDALPLTLNGKVDREALPAPDPGLLAATGSYAAPADPAEELLAGIWSEVLGLDAARVGVCDDFFALGGHSLLATQVASRIRKAFGVELPLRLVFEARTVRDLARVVQEVRRADAPQAPPLVPVPRKGALPLSFAQQRLWFLDQLEPDSPLYNVPVALRVEGYLGIVLLAKSLAALAQRHEALRTVFPAVEGSPMQVIRDTPDVQLPLIDLSGLPGAGLGELVRRLATEEAGRPFRLADGPLLRATVLRLGPQDHAVLLTLHHIVSDAWSMGVLVRELTALYEAYGAGRATPLRELPALPVQYADFASWQRGWLQGETLEREIAYWRGQLAGLPPLLELPVDHPRPAVRSLRGAALPVRLPADLAPRVRAFSRQEGATPFMVLLATFQGLLSRYSGQPDLAVGTPIAGRNHLETEGLIGFFVNTLVLRLRADLSEGPSFRELSGRVRETALAAHTHQDVPFEKLVEELAPDRSLSHTPLFQAVFSLQNTPSETPALAGARLSWLAAPTSTAKFDLTLALGEREGALEGSIEYSTDLFEAVTIERLALHFARLLAAALEEPGAGVGELPLLTDAERAELVAAWSPTTAWREETTLPELFREQVERRGETEALSFEDERLSYRELGRRVRSLANHLKGMGVGPEVRVGLCAERSAHLVVGLLAILEAGGVYVPLDPAYPAERLGFLMADSGVAVVVGQEAVRDRLPGGTWKWVPLEREPAPADGTAVPPLRLMPDAAAYVIYTSGSTGRPKGAVVSHRNVVRLLRSSEADFGFGPGDVWTLFHSFAFDFSVWELWGALAYGGRLVVVPYWVARSPQAFAGLLEQEGVTVLNQTPSAFRQLMRVEGEPALRLRILVFGSEALDPSNLRGFHQRYPAVRLVNMYGITE
ncbi:MAG TPA: condensation domain-containing protein, partial [Thermoanaerobaculia bacterium]|nr:condensation domain-containing protein [Thermoanaerobaculia bacterium]